MPSETTHALQFTSDPAKTGRVEKVTFIFMNQLHLCNGSDLVNVVNLKGRGRGRVRREGAAREGHERGKGGTGGSGKGGAGGRGRREGRELERQALPHLSSVCLYVHLPALQLHLQT